MKTDFITPQFTSIIFCYLLAALVLNDGTLVAAFSSRTIKRWTTSTTTKRVSSPLSAIWYEDDGPRRFDIDNFLGEMSSSSSSSNSRSDNKNLAKAATRKGDDNKRSKSSLSYFSTTSKQRTQYRDVVIVGGALAGLSTALYLSQLDPSRHITIVDRDDLTTVASMAAAGMLAPQSERLPKGNLLDLCMDSRSIYREFCDMVETMAQEAGEDGSKYLKNNNDTNNKKNKKSMRENDLPPWSVGYTASGGFLAPAFAGDSVATWAPPEENGAVWLDAMQVRELEPSLHPSVVGGWWFPEDASVDARRLTNSLRAACASTGNIQLLSGEQYEVTSLDLSEGTCKGLWLKSGKYVKCNSVLVANGAWMRQLLPVPMEPHKGQSLSLRMPSDRPPILRRVLFAQDCYICPKADGRIVVGATVEAGSYDPAVTPAGIMHILSHALQLVPALANLPIEETWVGLRPTTPDKGPILGKTPWDNLFLAGGYWRNGVLLAPKTGQLVAMLMGGKENELSAKDKKLLDAFAWDRFTSPEKSAAMTASARYAASMHPVHTRSTSGISAAVGTELGSYSTARTAGSERARDRQALWDDSSLEDAFEKAAAMGKSDGSAYVFGKDDDGNDDGSSKDEMHASKAAEKVANDDDDENTSYFEGSPDAYTVPADWENEESSSPVANAEGGDVSAAYEAIKQNKAKASSHQNLEDNGEEEKGPDPGFRIYYVDEKTDEKIEVPPYTSPGEFMEMMEKGETPNNSGKKAATSTKESDPSDLTSAYEAIKQNKAKQSSQVSNDNSKEDDRPDPGFRIYYVDEKTNEKIEVPPYTPPGDFIASLEEKSGTKPNLAAVNSASSDNYSSGYSETTFDGYQDIQQANTRNSRAEELQAMKEARIRNRLGQEQIDTSKIGVRDLSNEIPTSSRTNGAPNPPSLDAHRSERGARYDETTFDGYQDIQQANTRSSRGEELQAMREVRKLNRVGQDLVDESDV